MKTSYDFTINDRLEFQKDFLYNSKDYTKNKNRNYYIVPLSFLIVWLFQLSDPLELILIKLWLFTLMWILWVLFWYKFYDKVVIKNIRKHLEQWDNTALLWTHILELNNNEYTITEPGSEAKIKWSSIFKITENDDYFFIYITSNSSTIIPKFKLDENKEGIINFINQKKKELWKNHGN